MRERIDGLIKEFLSKKGFNEGVVRYEIEYPKREEFGDYSTNIALVLAKHLRKKPADIASEFIETIKDNPMFERVEIAGAGFVNFFLNPAFLFEELSNLKRSYFKPSIKDAKKIQVEFVSANPTGPLHVGHGRGAAIGDSIARILSFCGHKVEREYYINDAGLQMQLLGESTLVRYRQLFGMDDEIPEEGYRGEYLVEIAKKLMVEYGDSLLKMEHDEALRIATEAASEAILKTIMDTLEHFRVSFDLFFNEKRLYTSGEVESTIKFLSQKGYIYEKDGALWFKTTLFGDDKDRVIRRSNGAYTYFASDVAYHKNKFLSRNFDTVIDVWGSDHHGYVKRMKAAVEAIGVEPERLKIILVQIVNLIRSGKKVSMSTRKAEFVELKSILDEVGVDAARFMFVSRSTDSHLDFDLDLVKKQSSDNPVYYVQYAYARIANIFSQASLDKELYRQKPIKGLNAKEEIDLAKTTLMFKDHLLRAAEDLEPYFITRGLLEIAERLHKFYNSIRVVGSDKQDERLAMLVKVADTIKLGLDLIGVEAKERM